MPIYGDLRTLSLAELLRLAAETQKTGVLEVERDGISRRIEFRKGHVGSCSSNDPSSRLGQFLLARGRVNELQLQHLLTLQEATGKRLGLLLVEMSILTRQELASEVAANARETIHGLFDWDDAYFRFDDGATLDPDQIEVNLSVDQLIAEGSRRADHLHAIRRTFESAGVVVALAGHVPDDVFEGPFTRSMVESIDGRRTIREIVLHARAPEFVMLDLLKRLHDRGLLEVRGARALPEGCRTLLDPSSRRPVASPGFGFEPLGPDDAPRTRASASDSVGEMIGGIDRAVRLLEDRKYAEAVELLRERCVEPGSDYARRLLAKAEGALVEAAWSDESFAASFPRLRRPEHELLADDPAPDEAFLIRMIDGVTDTQAIVWLTPMREVDVIMALKRMARAGTIGLSPTPASPRPDRAEPALPSVG